MGMEFELNREEKMIQKAIRDFVAGSLAYDVVREIDGTGTFPEKMLTALSELGFTGLSVSEEFGGEGVNLLGACIVTEELARRYPALAACYSNAVFAAAPVINAFGRDDQKERFLPGIARGEIRISPALDEAYYHMDNISTRAEADPEGFIISGEKTMVVMGDAADYFLVAAKRGHGDGLSLFFVDATATGITRNKVATLGFWGEGPVNLVFDRVRVESRAILGGIGQIGQFDKKERERGKEIVEALQNFQLLGIGAQAVGIAQGAFDLALSHAKSRVQFDQVIGKFTAIQEKLTDLSCDIKGSRLLVYNALLAAAAGRKFAREIAMAKITAARTAVQASMEGLQLFGGYGYSMEYDIQRYVRDAAGTLSAGIDNDLLSQKLAESMGL